MAKAVAGRKFQVLNFAYHLPKLWTDKSINHYQVRHEIQL